LYSTIKNPNSTWRVSAAGMRSGNYYPQQINITISVLRLSEKPLKIVVRVAAVRS
jgi:hypothetical protein